ncbi:MAG: trimethylamine methyltransferase family protein [Pseudomonadota bacterium]
MARRARRESRDTESRQTEYRQITNTLPRSIVFSEDEVEHIHQTSLRVLRDLGIRILNPEARRLLIAEGCDERADMMIHYPPELVEEKVALAPPSFLWHGAPGYAVEVGPSTLLFGPGAGCPNANDLDRGRRPGSLQDFKEATQLAESFEVIQKLGPSVEPQDVPVAMRHLETLFVQVTESRKIPFIFSRGTRQVEDSFRLLMMARGVDEATFKNTAYVSTVVNTNSPRQIDVPMAQGIIDFAIWGQVNVITPFCLSGAMAPITPAGSLTLSHAEAMAGITLAQVVRPGAPVVYGAFSSNVDMKSGAPVFGTPEHIRTNFGAGQLARRLGIPWRSASGTASNAPDVQAAMETQAGLWGAVLGGANLIYHSAGWLEGGLTFGYEKFITDLEICQTIAEAMLPVETTEEAIGFDAIAEVEPGGHFFSASQTMNRYATQFYEPVISDWSNFGQWTEGGSVSATDRAHDLWKKTLAEFEPPPMDAGLRSELEDFVARRKAEGGAPIME